MPLLTVLFVVLIAIEVCTRLWLARRQIQHVQFHSDQVPLEFEGRISLYSHQRAARYTTDRTKLGMLEVVFDAALLLLLTFGGGLQLLNQWSMQWFDPGMWANIVFVGLVAFFVGALHLPFTLYRQFSLEARYGFNRMTLKLFLTDLFKGTLIAAVLGTPLLALILWFMQATGSTWWIWSWAAWVLFNLCVMFIFPTWIAPLFNRFTPLQDQALKERIEALAQRCGFEIQGLFVMDGSRRSAHGNAYFTGFGKSRRIVFFDTLLSKLNADEIEAVLAHELGHFKHKHITRRLLMSLLTAFILFAVLGWLGNQAWFYTGLGVHAPEPLQAGAMSLVLFFMVMPVFTFWLAPLVNQLSRRDEFEADRFAAKQSDAKQLINALVKLFDDNAATLTPDPLHSAFYDTHPPASVRIQQLAAQS